MSLFENGLMRNLQILLELSYAALEEFVALGFATQKVRLRFQSQR